MHLHNIEPSVFRKGFFFPSPLSKSLNAVQDVSTWLGDHLGIRRVVDFLDSVFGLDS